jgi:hypothetical protein
MSLRNRLKKIKEFLIRRVPGVLDEIFATIILAILGYLLVRFSDDIFPPLFLFFKKDFPSLIKVFIALINQNTGIFAFVVILVLLFVIFYAIYLHHRRQMARWQNLNEVEFDSNYDEFVKELERVFQIEGYGIESENHRGFIRLVLSQTDDLSVPRVAVAVEPNEHLVLTRANIKGLLIAASEVCADRIIYIAKEPRPFFRNQRLIKAFQSHGEFKSYSEIANVGVNFRPYLQFLVKDWEDSKEAIGFVDIIGKSNDLELDPLGDWLDNKLLNAKEPTYIALLGDFGTGKTTFLRYYSYLLARSYLQKSFSPRIPIFVSLRDFELSENIGTLVADTLLEHGVAAGFDHLRSPQLKERIVLILDAFDEMTLTVDRLIVQRNLQQIQDIVSHGPKAIILSCRTHFFRDSIEEKQLKSFEIINIKQWGEPEQKQFLQNIVGQQWQSSFRKIKHTHNLQELAQTPLFLDMIVDSLDGLHGNSIRSAELYTTYTNKWIESQIYKSVLDRDQKAEFMGNLAWTMITQGQRSIPWSDLRDFVQEHYELPLTEVSRFDNDIRTCSFLKRSRLGYAFAHSSFLEFFVAQILSDQIKQDKIDDLCQVELSYEVIGFMAQMLDELVYYERLHLWLEYRIEKQYAGARRNAAHILRTISRSRLPIRRNRNRKVRELSNIILTDDDDDVRWRALVSLGWFRANDGIDVLQHVLCDDDEEVRLIRIAALILGLLGESAAIPRMTDLIDNAEHYLVRQNCALALGLLGDSSGIPNLVANLSREESYEVRRTIIWAIESIDPIMASGALIKTALDDPSEEVRQYATYACGRLARDTALNTLSKTLRDPSLLVRCATLETLGRIGGKSALDLIKSVLNDPALEVREAAQYASNLIESDLG